jgi:uncharacterized protein (DUF608 family)
MPLGGIGAGQVALGGDGSLRQWQIVNQVNHLGSISNSFFAIRAFNPEPPLDVTRVLQSRAVLDLPEGAAPLVNDHVIPRDLRLLLEHCRGVESTTFSAAYPFARIQYHDAALPLGVTLEAWSPFIPLNSEESGLPAVIFTFTLVNTSKNTVRGCLAAALQNAAGWDGMTPISGNRCALFGGNVNRTTNLRGAPAILMDNPSLPDDAPGWGQMALGTLSPTARPVERFANPEDLFATLRGVHLDGQLDSGIAGPAYVAERHHKSTVAVPLGPSPTGETWSSALLAPFRVAPGETTEITFIIAWYFPNRYVNFDQFGAPRRYGKSRFWLGNAYAARFAGVEEVLQHVVANVQSLREASASWPATLFDSTLPAWMAEALALQAVPLCSPTSFRTESGAFFGFEGGNGASTAMLGKTYGGSCPLNCSHVWNYEQALSRLFPDLERSMRETEFEVAQAPDGSIPHRVYMPLYLPQLWNESIGGPEAPALDGMLGAILKVYREVRQGAGSDWLGRMWPRVVKLMRYICDRWDPHGEGVLRGEQPNTYDISFYGANMFIGSLWLAALRAAEELARIHGDAEYAGDLRQRFTRSSEAYDTLLWNGEYYRQELTADDPGSFQYGDGCLADQLIGQWWAHLLDLGYILPQEHVRQTLCSILRHNLRHDFHGFEHGYRVFADGSDSGLLLCSWPHGGRPETPVRYADEVWTGIEYQVGAHCIMEGMVEEGLEIVRSLRARYSGERRNPFNEIECGDHYARSLAGWSLLDAVSGFRYDAQHDRMAFSPMLSTTTTRLPVMTATGWGTYEQEGYEPWSRVMLTCTHGAIRIAALTLPPAPGLVRVTVDGRAVEAALSSDGASCTLTLAGPLVLSRGDQLVVTCDPARA